MFGEADLLLIPGIQKVEHSFNGSDGGFKLVYKCVVNGVPNAIKVTKVAGDHGVNNEIIARLRKELELLNALSSPFLPMPGQLPVQRYDKSGDGVYIVYSEDFIEGADVCELIDNGFFSDSSQIQKLVHDVVSAIEIYWNYAQVVHRDIKPANIRYSSASKKFVLIDAGIALVKSATSITPTGHGSPRTPQYVSPEVIRLQRNLTFRTDLFSLGIVSYEAATGKHPFYVAGMTEDELYDAILNKEQDRVKDLRPDLDPRLANLIDSMLKKRPHQRPSRIRDIMSIL